MRVRVSAQVVCICCPLLFFRPTLAKSSNATPFPTSFDPPHPKALPRNSKDRKVERERKRESQASKKRTYSSLHRRPSRH